MTRRVPLAAILLFAAILRFWGIAFGLPHTWARPDEDAVMVPAVRMVQGDLNPHWFQYPSLYMYALAPLYATYYVEQRARGGIQSRAELLDLYFRFPDSFHLLNRWLAATLGVLTIVVLWRTARRLFSNETALLSALMLAAVPLHVRDSHFGVADVPATFMVMVAFWAIVRWSASPSRRALIIAGICCGLAASTKYNAAVMLVPGVVAIVQHAWSDRHRARTMLTEIALLCGTAALGFLCGTPYALLDPRAFVAGVTAVGQHMAEGHGQDLGAGWSYHLATTLRHGLGLPLLVTALAGMVWMATVQRRTALLVFAFPLVYYAAAGSTRTVFFRYLIPIVPLLCLAAAWAVERIATQLAPRARGLAMAGLAVLLLAVPMFDAIRMDVLLRRQDSRVLAADWVRDRVPSGLTVYQSGAFYGHLQFGRPPHLREAALGADGAFRVNGAATADGPDLLVVQTSPLMYSRDVPLIAEMAANRYERIAEFRAYDPSQSAFNIYDPIDAFYLPLRGFRGVERPGPNITIYRRRSP